MYPRATSKIGATAQAWTVALVEVGYLGIAGLADSWALYCLSLKAWIEGGCVRGLGEAESACHSLAVDEKARVPKGAHASCSTGYDVSWRVPLVPALAPVLAERAPHVCTTCRRAHTYQGTHGHAHTSVCA